MLCNNRSKLYSAIVLFYSRGQLGQSSVDSKKVPTLLDALNGIEMIKISAGGWHSTAISGNAFQSCLKVKWIYGVLLHYMLDLGLVWLRYHDFKNKIVKLE